MDSNARRAKPLEEAKVTKLGGKTPKCKEERRMEERRKETRDQWKRVWEGGKPQETSDSRRKMSARRRNKTSKDEVKKEEKAGASLKGWLYKPPEIEVKRSKIAEIKMKLGLDIKNKKEGEEETDPRKGFKALLGMFEDETKSKERSSYLPVGWAVTPGKKGDVWTERMKWSQ